MPALQLKFLGDFEVVRDGVRLALPPSKKTRALLAYLALNRRSFRREHLCELLWDIPNDPRGELRWCLSKLRGVLDDTTRSRVVSDGDTVALALADCSVDAVTIGNALQAGIEALDRETLRALSNLFTGEFLEDVEIDREPQFMS